MHWASAAGSAHAATGCTSQDASRCGKAVVAEGTRVTAPPRGLMMMLDVVLGNRDDASTRSSTSGSVSVGRNAPDQRWRSPGGEPTSSIDCSAGYGIGP